MYIIGIGGEKMKYKIAGCVALTLIGAGLIVLIRSIRTVDDMLNGEMF